MSQTYQRCRVKLGDDMMDEDSKVGGPRLQQVNALEGAALTINLTENEQEKENLFDSFEDQKFQNFFLNQILQ